MWTATVRRALLFPKKPGPVEIMATPRHITVSEESRPVLPRHAKLKFDETRKVWVLLAPERVLAPDEIAVEVLQLCDGVRTVAIMVDELAAKYAAPREAILTDVIAMLQDLADKGFLTEAREKTP
jgi:pyrroloquinoline quinone biosynthesis protein D